MALTRILFCLIAIAMAVPATMGQPNDPPPTQLALEVQFYPNTPPGYQSVPPRGRSGGWWGRFARVPGWQQPADWPEVSAVEIKSELAEDGIRIWVSAFLGKMREQTRMVASYVIREHEKKTVRELADLGVQPFEIKVIRVNLAAMELPQFRSKAKSIELVVMQPKLSTMPAFEVVVRNVSDKNVNALSQQVFQSGRRQISSMPQGKEGQVLIPPGGTYAFTVPIAVRAMPTADSFTPVVLPNQTIEVSTAVFVDGSFEGDSEPALSFTGFQKGRSIQLARVIGLLDNILAANSTGAPDLASLRAQVSALNYEPGSDEVQQVRVRFPAANDGDLKRPIEISMKSTRDQILTDLDQFTLHNRRFPSPTAREWLTAAKERYQAWLNRL